MFDEIRVLIESLEAPPRFRLGERGSPPRIATATVSEIGADQPSWRLVAVSFATELPFIPGAVAPAGTDESADEEPLDPIEDLPPSDPRHRGAIAERDRLVTAFPLLESLTYGVIPPGFRQATPGLAVPALIPGRSYSLSVMGPDGGGGVTFQVKPPDEGH